MPEEMICPYCNFPTEKLHTNHIFNKSETPVCMKCLVVWYDKSPESTEELRAIRQEQEAESVTCGCGDVLFCTVQKPLEEISQVVARLQKGLAELGVSVPITRMYWTVKPEDIQALIKAYHLMEFKISEFEQFKSAWEQEHPIDPTKPQAGRA